MKTILEENREWIENTWEKIEKKLSAVCIRSRNKLPYTCINGVHDNKAESRVSWWTNGFWGGMMWLMYVATQKEDYKITAMCSEALLDKALEDYKILHHDVGFLWHLTSVANYRITGNKASYNKALYMAATLFSRFNIEGQFIRAWNHSGDVTKNWTIIDCMMNLSLLYWASEEIGDDRFAKVAKKQADVAGRDHVRQDGSVNHIVEHDEKSGELVKVHVGQGYDESSCWARGAAWAIYGFVLSYIHTNNTEYLDTARKVADYFIENCKKTDYLPLIDFCAPAEPVYYDSTAGVCAASGILEIAKYVSEEEGRRYTKEAINILKACDTHFCNYAEDEDALVLMGSERYPHNDDEMSGVHIPIIYGDFFFVEAMYKLIGNDFLIW